MNEFQSWDSFETFSISIKETSRFCLTPEARNFLETVLSASRQHLLSLSKGLIYWRARKGYTLGQLPSPFENLPLLLPHPEDQMKPIPKSPSEGRCTPKGMSSCLYVSDDTKTAISEVRPAVGDYVSVAEMALVRELSLVDFTGYVSDDYTYYENEPLPEEREHVVWAAIGREFSIPVNPDDSTKDYIPTQAIAERLRIAGYDGLAYRSRLGGGLNLALFDVDAVQVRDRTLHRVNNVEYECEPIGSG